MRFVWTLQWHLLTPQTQWEQNRHKYWEGKHCVCMGRCSLTCTCSAQDAVWQGICWPYPRSHVAAWALSPLVGGVHSLGQTALWQYCCGFSGLVLASIRPLHMASKSDVVCPHCLKVSSLLLCDDILHPFISVYWLNFCLLWWPGLFLSEWGYIAIEHMENPDQRWCWQLSVSWRGHHTVYFGTKFVLYACIYIHPTHRQYVVKNF